jgi:hypothetical protein
MLVHHADAEPEGVGGIADLDRSALDQDRARVGRVGAEEHVHQAGLARAVLAEEPEHVAGAQGQIDAVAGGYRAEALDDAAHRQKGRGGVARAGHDLKERPGGNCPPGSIPQHLNPAAARLR